MPNQQIDLALLASKKILLLWCTVDSQFSSATYLFAGLLDRFPLQQQTRQSFFTCCSFSPYLLYILIPLKKMDKQVITKHQEACMLVSSMRKKGRKKTKNKQRRPDAKLRSRQVHGHYQRYIYYHHKEIAIAAENRRLLAKTLHNMFHSAGQHTRPSFHSIEAFVSPPAPPILLWPGRGSRIFLPFPLPRVN